MSSVNGGEQLLVGMNFLRYPKKKNFAEIHTKGWDIIERFSSVDQTPEFPRFHFHQPYQEEVPCCL